MNYIFFFSMRVGRSWKTWQSLKNQTKEKESGAGKENNLIRKAKIIQNQGISSVIPVNLAPNADDKDSSFMKTNFHS